MQVTYFYTKAVLFVYVDVMFNQACAINSDDI